MTTTYQNLLGHCRPLALMLFLCLMGTLSLQAQQSPLVGSWTFDAGPSFSGIPGDIQEHLDSLPSVRASVYAGYTGRTLVFGADGSFQQSLPNGASLSGSWSVSAGVLYLQHGNGHQLALQIIQLDTGSLVLSPQGTDGARPMVPQLYFTKN